MNLGIKPTLERIVTSELPTADTAQKSWLRGYFDKFSGLLLRAIFFNGMLVETAISAVLLYMMFYWLYMPIVEVNQPVYFNFSDGGASAAINLYDSKGKMKLANYQSYNMELYLKVPTSEANQNIGNFMVSLELINGDNEPYQTFYKPAICKYRSALVRQIHGLTFFFPMLITGIGDESEELYIRMISGVSDLQKNKIKHVVVSLDRRLQVYNAELRIAASFSGIRYFMYYWKLPSASLFIGISFLLQLTFGLLSWALLEKYIKNNSLSNLENRLGFDFDFNRDNEGSDEEDMPQASTPTRRFIKRSSSFLKALAESNVFKHQKATETGTATAEASEGEGGGGREEGEGTPVPESILPSGEHDSVVPNLNFYLTSLRRHPNTENEIRIDRDYISPSSQQRASFENLPTFETGTMNIFESSSASDAVPASEYRPKNKKNLKRRNYTVKI